MPSGAGHDAQDMALIAPTAMIFVPSRDGISHSPEEFTSFEMIYKGANVLLNTIVELDLRNFPNQTAASSTLGPFTITSSTNYQSCRARGRSVAVKISNTAIDSNWKLGTFRLDVHAGGRR